MVERLTALDKKVSSYKIAFDRAIKYETTKKAYILNEDRKKLEASPTIKLNTTVPKVLWEEVEKYFISKYEKKNKKIGDNKAQILRLALLTALDPKYEEE